MREDTAETLVLIMEEALKPFARTYVELTPEKQLSLAGFVPVSITNLRDAYLVLSRVKRSSRPPPPV